MWVLRRVPEITGRRLVLGGQGSQSPIPIPEGFFRWFHRPMLGSPHQVGAPLGAGRLMGLAAWPLGLPEPAPALSPEVMGTSSNPFPGVLFKGRQA